MFSPPHTSTCSEAGNRTPDAAGHQRRNTAAITKIGGLLSAFPNVTPASLPDRNGPTPNPLTERWTIPESYVRHWERVPDILKHIPVQMKGFQSASMTPTPEHEGRMYGESKCFSLLASSSLEHLAGPFEGMTYCFIAESLSEIPDICLKVLFFFDNVRKIMQSQDRSPFVFPTDKIGLTVRYFVHCFGVRWLVLT